MTAEDAGGTTVTSYTGTVHFTSTDLSATLPADYTFSAADLGSHDLPVTFKTAGPRELDATDVAFPTTQGALRLNVDAGAPSRLVLSGLPATTPAGVPMSKDEYPPQRSPRTVHTPPSSKRMTRTSAI